VFVVRMMAPLLLLLLLLLVVVVVVVVVFLDDLEDRRGYSHSKEEALDRIKWRNFGRGCGPVV
jgi:hypothetical protein